MKNIDLMKTLPNTCEAALFFMQEEGHYIFVYKKDKEVISKTILSDDVAAAFSKEEARTQWIPASVRVTGYSKKGKWFVAVYNPGKITVTWKGFKEDITYPVPPTLLLSVGGKHYFFAIKDPDEVTRHTHLHYAPYMNCNDSGNVCWGTNDHIRSDPENADKIWKTFLNSIATHSDNDKVSKKYKTLEELVANLQGKRKYPLEDLVGYNTLGNMVDNLCK